MTILFFAKAVAAVLGVFVLVIALLVIFILLNPPKTFENTDE